MIFVNVETRTCNWAIAVKRERYAQVLCVYFLLAAPLQVTVWFMWNSSLYRLAFIYRLNQSKVYIWSNFCTFADVRLYGHAMTLLLPKTKRAFLYAFLFWAAMSTPMILVSGKSSRIVWVKSRVQYADGIFNKIIKCNQRKPKKQ